MSINIAMWSGPRNLSTAMMRSFENRPDAIVWDEPFYAAYLTLSGLEHPMRDEVIDAGEPRWETVSTACMDTSHSATVFYQKHMTHHMLPQIGTDWMNAVEHGFLLRDPVRVLLSYVAKRESVELADIGVEQQWSLFERVADRTGSAPLVVDSADFLNCPESHLRAMCEHWDIDFLPDMLRWAAGPRASDGAWAPHWYASVWQSTGFAAPRAEKPESLPSHLQRIADAAVPYYEKILPYRIQPA